MNPTAQIKIPPKLIPVFTPPRGSLRYRGAYGGRGSAKSRTFATMAGVFGYQDPIRILCVREYLNSIRESFHAELKTAITSTPWLDESYNIGVDYIRGKNGTECFFKGMQNMSSIKSISNIDLCIVEEAEDAGENSWVDLLPTIRKPKSEIWVIWNSKKNGSATDTRFKKNKPPRSRIVEMNYKDNPVFPAVLEEQRLADLETLDIATYRHIWEGQYLVKSDAQILADKYTVQEFTPGDDWDGPYFGLDWGFSQDPTTAVKIWIHAGKIWIEYEAGQVGLELDQTGAFMINRIPGIESRVCRADNARPESISFVRRNGLPKLEGVTKWPGSVEDGIEHIKSYLSMVIHPRCKATINECDLYSFRVDRKSGEVTDAIVDAHNHYIDAIRYALNPMIKSGNTGYLDFIRMKKMEEEVNNAA